jgi:hypothetical protein
MQQEQDTLSDKTQDDARNKNNSTRLTATNILTNIKMIDESSMPLEPQIEFTPIKNFIPLD